MNQKSIELIAPRLTELFIRKINSLATAWQKPWVADPMQGIPRNLRGTPYRAGNALLLLFLTELEGYRSPLFLTFNQAKEEGLHIQKGATSFPVYFWKIYIRHKETHRALEAETYRHLPAAEQKQYAVTPVMRYYSVFNIDQTDMPDKQPNRYAMLIAEPKLRNLSDGLLCPELDTMLADGRWLCPIELKYSDRAYFSHTLNKIGCPLKSQFSSGAAFYGTLLHEMTHSTGTKERLNRKFGTRFGDADYAREELVAELTSALCGITLGFSTTPRDENAAYLKHWLRQLDADPSFLFGILTDVNKAAKLIEERVNGTVLEGDDAA